MRASLDPSRFRQSLLRLLEADPPNEERLLAELERRKDQGESLHSAILYILTHLSFAEPEAHRHWLRIRKHRERMRAALGREPGLRVAILDYFVNVNRELTNPKVIEISIYERTARSAVTDGLTGLYNRAFFAQALKRELQRAQRHRTELALALFDLDNFKKLNDTRGHVEGDRALIRTAALLKESLREIDVAARYGGEEFAVILPDTSRLGAFVVAERVRQKIERSCKRRRCVGVTVSGGIASFPEDAEEVEALVRKADAALYRSKADGKNRITLVRGERRRHPRFTAAYPLTLSAPPAVRAARARTEDLSATGMRLRLRQPVPLGAAVSLVIRPRHESPLALKGEVVRVTKTGNAHDVGVRLQLDPSQAVLVFRRLGTSIAAGA